MNKEKLVSKRMLFLCLLSLSFSLSSCDVYRAFKENREVVKFLNEQLNPWLREEKEILSQYNFLVQSNKFSSKQLWQEITKSFLPSISLLREKVNKYVANKSETKLIKKKFLHKLDLLWEGFDLIKEGLKISKASNSKDPNTPSGEQMLQKGKLKLQEVRKINKEIEEVVLKLIKKYYIKLKNNPFNKD